MSQQGKPNTTYYTGLIKRLPYDLFSKPQKPVYDIDNYAEQQLHVLANNIHNKVHEKLQVSRTKMMVKQHKKAKPVNTKE